VEVVPKRRLDVDISPIRNDFYGVNVSHNSQKVIVDSLENTQANEAADSH